MNSILFKIIRIAPVILVACGCMKNSTKHAAAPKSFRYAIRTNPTTLDPAHVIDLETLNLHRQIYEGLVGWNSRSKIIPKFAKSWKVGNGGKEYLFTLNKAVRFSNGRLATAHDVKWSIERNCSQGLASPIAKNFFSNIVGAQLYMNGKAPEISGIKVVSPYKLKILLESPRIFFLGKLAHPIAAILDRKKVPFDQPISSPDKSVSIAPFYIKSYIKDQLISLYANSYYHAGIPEINKIEIPVIKDAVSCLNKYKAGELDLTYVQSPEVPHLRKDPKYSKHLRIQPTCSLLYLGLNRELYPPFKLKAVRRAFAMSIDRRHIMNNILNHAHLPAYGLIPQHVMGHRMHTRLPSYDPIEAKYNLKSAGFNSENPLPPLKLTLIGKSPAAQKCAEAIAIQLQQNLGVNIQLQKLEMSAFYQKRNHKDLAFFLTGWMPDYLDPENFVSALIKSDSPYNYMKYKNLVLDQLCREADSCQDQEKRLKLYAHAEDIALKEVALLPIYFFRDVELINPKVKGLGHSLFGHLPYSRVYFK